MFDATLRAEAEIVLAKIAIETGKRREDLSIELEQTVLGALKAAHDRGERKKTEPPPPPGTEGVYHFSAIAKPTLNSSRTVMKTMVRIEQKLVYICIPGQTVHLDHRPDRVWALMPSPEPISVPIRVKPWSTVAPMKEGVDWVYKNKRMLYRSKMMPASVWLLLEFDHASA